MNTLSNVTAENLFKAQMIYQLSQRLNGSLTKSRTKQRDPIEGTPKENLILEWSKKETLSWINFRNLRDRTQTRSSISFQ